MNNRNNNLLFFDAYRFILCLMVVLGHFYNYIGGRNYWGIRLIGGMGAKAVDVFFFITAFFTVYSFENKNIDEIAFIKKRFLRLYPLYIIAVLIGYFMYPVFTYINSETLLTVTGDIIGPWGNPIVGTDTFPALADLFSHIFLIHGVVVGYGTGIIGPLWTMSVEWFFYLLFAVLIFIVRKSRFNLNQIIILFSVITLIIGCIIRIRAGEDLMQTFLRSLPVFALGMVTAELYLDKINRIIAICLMSVLTAYLFLLDITQNWLCVGIILSIIFLLFIDANNKLKLFINKLFGMSCFQVAGKYSYEIYLFHMIIIPVSFGIALKIFSTRSYLLIFSALCSIVIMIALLKIRDMITSRGKE